MDYIHDRDVNDEMENIRPESRRTVRRFAVIQARNNDGLISETGSGGGEGRMSVSNI